VRDISLFGALSNVTIIQPCNALETRQAVAYCIQEARENCMLRLIIGPSPRVIELPSDYALTIGQGTALTEGADAILFAYGPVMLHEALLAAEYLRQQNFHLKVINMPWLNRIDRQWIMELIRPYSTVYVLEDHSSIGGLGDYLLNTLNTCQLIKGRQFKTFGLSEYPAWGTPSEVLTHHGLDGKSLSDTILAENHRL